MFEHVLWSEKFRPDTLEDCFLPSNTLEKVKSYISTGEIPSMLFSGTSGIGKTTVAKVIAKETQSEFILINASLDGNIDTLRTKIKEYATSISMNFKRKIIILDEADHLTAATQAALRNFIDEYSANCIFILTCNNVNRIIPAIISRLTEVSFIFPKDEKNKLKVGILKFLRARLDEGSVKTDLNSLKDYVSNAVDTKTDIRSIINNAQTVSVSGEFNAASIHAYSVERFDGLKEFIARKDFASARIWIAENGDIDPTVVFRNIYDNSLQYAPKELVPDLILIIGRYQDMHTRAIDKEINLAACVVEIMMLLSR